ncbi:MAG: Sua5/YciO/YrdC/YwlC family protein, partial [Deltaproteobacteria bacterium]|nr:Sua5/YciO/YrdC/YwlC family protein [Deltaproteobacteria bacterium]
MPNNAPLIINASATLDEAREAFKRGGVIAYPTETFYGLCVDPFNKEAIEKLFTLKGRSPKSPISVIISDVSMLDEIAAGVTQAASALMKRFWPGPLTI